MRYIAILTLMMLAARIAWAVPSNTISTPNDFVAGTTAVADDVDSNFSEHQTKFNAHDHNDINDTTSNSFSVGDATNTGNKRFIANRASTDAEIRYNVTDSDCEFTNDGSTYQNIPTVGGIIQSFRNTAGDTATTSTSFVDVPGLSVTWTPASTSRNIILFEGSGYVGGTADDVRVRLMIDNVAEEGTERLSGDPANSNWFIATSTNKALSNASHTAKAQWRSNNGNTQNLRGHSYVLHVIEVGSQ